MKTRALSLFLALVLVIAMLPVTAQAAEPDNSFQYKVYTDHVEIVGYTPTIGTVVEIPSKIEGLPVTVINDYAFFYGTGITSFTIPDTVTKIGSFAFAYCYALTNIKFSGNAPSFGRCAFSGVQATAQYPAGNPTWTNSVKQNYDGRITWVSYNPNPFTDVPAGSFFEAAVLWAVNNGITNGTTDTTFDPNGNCLRAQAVTFLHRAANNPEPTSTNNPFTDVKAGDYFYKPVLWAVEKGITKGTSTTIFGYKDNCNRAQVVTFLWRAAGSPNPRTTTHPFVDVAKGGFYEKAVLWAVENDITKGVDATHFGPNTPCNRAQVVTFLYRANQ